MGYSSLSGKIRIQGRLFKFPKPWHIVTVDAGTRSPQWTTLA